MIKYYWLQAIMIMFIAFELVAQPGRGLNQNSLTRLYDPANGVTIDGKIEHIKKAQSGYGRFPGTLLIVALEAQKAEVYLAPDWFLDQEDIAFKTDQKITVTGSKVVYQQKDLILCREIKTDDQTFTIRNANGIPVWAGKRMGPGQGRGRRR
ncbi:hypothetical protein GF406_21070 [candidate division KSB1 bacterium]|nr:hypothetical protein [candidate division KSB1 bacterium]